MNHGIRIAVAILAGPLLALAATACAEGDTTEGLSSFGGPGYGPVSGGGSAAGDDESESDGDAGDDETESDGPADPPADDPEADTGDTGDEPAPPAETGDDPMDPPPDPPPDPGAAGSQPNAGMYAPCTENDLSACGSGTLGCMYVDLPSGQDGYCTPLGCTNPAADCDAAPAGTSVTPICIPVGADTTCALDCSTAACPTGMQCVTLALDDTMTASADVCI